MNRWLIIAGAGLAVFGSYLAVLFGVAGDSQVGPLKIAAIALPGIVTGLAMGGYVLWESRNVREARHRNEELSAQLVRKEIEIGRLATVDELTGLYTRREFDEMIRLELERNKRHGREFALLLLEIDDIAELGEHVGALNKGFLIAEVSAILTHMLRTNDLGCRYTADSLAMLLPETNAHQARVVTEKVRRAIDKHDFLGQVQQRTIKLTVSQGVAVAGKELSSHVELAKAAERALAEARAGGFDEVKIVEAGTAAPDKKIA